MKNNYLFKGAIIALFFIVIIALLIRPVKITTDNFSKTYILWAFEKGDAEFINSVTGAKVKISFTLKNVFQDFYMKTDEKTENYYTSGFYDINKLLKKEKKDELYYCSVKGIKLTLGSYKFNIKNNCLKVKVLWSPNKLF